MGYENCSPNFSTNWLSPSQLGPGNQFFTRKKGWIKPTPEFLAEIDGLSQAVMEVNTSEAVVHPFVDGNALAGADNDEC